MHEGAIDVSEEDARGRRGSGGCGNKANCEIGWSVRYFDRCEVFTYIGEVSRVRAKNSVSSESNKLSGFLEKYDVRWRGMGGNVLQQEPSLAREPPAVPLPHD